MRDVIVGNVKNRAVLVELDLSIDHPQQSALKPAPAVDGLPGLELDVAPREALEVGELDEWTLEPRRTDFESIGATREDVLAGLTRNRFMGAITGAFVTAVLNSSSVTTVLVVGFISAGFMTLTQSVGIIMGANIGSTFTA